MLGTDIELGMEVRDSISGFTGIVTKMGDHLAGCTRVGVFSTSPSGDRGNEEFFFPSQLEIVSDSTVFQAKNNPVTETDFETGQLLEDEMTGFEGYAIIINYSLYNCPQIRLKSGEDPSEAEWFDEPQLVAVSDEVEFDYDDFETATEATTGSVGTDKADSPYEELQ